MIISRT